MTILEIILSICTFLFGGGGIVTSIVFYKQNKILKESEAAESELKLNDFWHTALDECQEDLEHWRKLSLEKDTRIQELNVQINSLIKELGIKDLEHQHSCFWKCTVKGCPNRVPPQEI